MASLCATMPRLIALPRCAVEHGPRVPLPARRRRLAASLPLPPPRPLPAIAPRTLTSTCVKQLQPPPVQPTSNVPALGTQVDARPCEASSGQELRALLSAHFPFEELQFVATYGSAAFAQLTEEEATARDKGRSSGNDHGSAQSTSGEESMLDLIFAVADPLAFHRANMARNPSHYSAIRWAAPWPCLIAKVQEYGAGVWYNTLIRLEVPDKPGQTRLVKYGVVSTDRLIRDLRDWDALYLAGRMHKPMQVLACTELIREAAECNLRSALRTSMLLLDSSSAASPPAADPSPAGTSLVRATGQSFFTVLSSLSYAGDIRMGFAENPHKVAKIVVGNWCDLVPLYARAVQQVIGPTVTITQLKEPVQFECDAARRLELLEQLPHQVQAEIAASTPSSSLPSLVLLPPSDRHAALSRGLAQIVARSSKQQTMKGLLTAGVSKSLRYAWAKVKKATNK